MTDPQPPALPGRGFARVITVAAAVHATSMLPLFLTGALGGELQREFSFGPAALGAATGSFVLARAAASLALGPLTDRLGATQGMRLSSIGCGLAATAIAVLVRGWAGLVVVLVFAGAVQAISQPAANRFVARSVPHGRLGAAFGWKQSGPPVATGLAGLAVPALALTLGWRSAFVAGALLCLATLLAIPPRPSRAPEPAGSGTQGAAGRASPTGRVAPGLGPIMLADALTLGAITSTHTFVVQSGAEAGIPMGWSGVLLTGGSVVAILMRVLLGIQADRRGGGHLLLVSRLLLVGAVGFVLLATGLRVPFVLGVALIYGGAWGMTGLLYLAVVQHNPQAPAAATGRIVAGGSLGGFLGPPAFGYLVEQVGYGAAWSATAVAIAFAAWVVRLSPAATAAPPRPA